MKSEEKLNFRLTTDLQAKKTCAEMMQGTDPWITLGLDYAHCLKAFEGYSKEIILAEYENQIAGFAILQTSGTFNGYIQTLCIDEKYRGKGMGRKLLQYCESRILEYSPNVFICVSSFNKGAIKLYFDFGFTLVGELENFVKDGYNELLLRKTVGAKIGYKKAKK
jgi:ribosomal protein S18 acetylase RimI-like enzyme